MQIITDSDFTGFEERPWAKGLRVLAYRHGGTSHFPLDFFRDWRDEPLHNKHYFYIGHCSYFNHGSILRYGARSTMRVGRFVSGGAGCKFLIDAQHDMRRISTATTLLRLSGVALAPDADDYGDIVIKNDVWIGAEAMLLGGAVVENGCVIGARALLPPSFRSDPYGIYGGTPARLIRFRFDDRVIEALLALSWWDMPVPWIARNNSYFAMDLTTDPLKAVEMLTQLRQLQSPPVAAEP